LRTVNSFLFKICILPPEVVAPLAPCAPNYAPCSILLFKNSDIITPSSVTVTGLACT
jgi:hypothetical protein